MLYLVSLTTTHNVNRNSTRAIIIAAMRWFMRTPIEVALTGAAHRA